jgi:hypothetical protein
MNRKKYKISKEDYRNFEKQYLMDLIRDPDKYMPFGKAFLTKFNEVLKEYTHRGGDMGLQEAGVLWIEPDMEKAKRIIAMWIE